MKVRFISKTLFCLLILTLLISSGSVFSQEAKLTNIIVTNTRDDLLLYLNVEGAFTDKIITAVYSGAPVSFNFFISLYLVRNMWPDKNIADFNLTHTIEYDPLKKEYTVERSWDNGDPVVTQDFAEAKKLMTAIESLKIIPLSKLEKGKQYQIRAKAELSKTTLPFYLHYVLFFASLWDFETDWYTIDFIY